MKTNRFTTRASALAGIIILLALLASACIGSSPSEVQATVNAAVLTAAPGAAQAQTLTAPSAPSGPAATSAPGASIDARGQRLLSADANYRSQGAAAWARQLGSFSFDSLTMEARQPEEETFAEANGDAMTVVSGIQVRVTNLKVTSPGCFTTDQKVAGQSRFIKPDNFDPIKNPSVLYTDNEVGFSGTATLWGDCSNWANLMSAPVAEFTTTSAPAYSAPASTAAPASTLTMADLAKLGNVVQRLEYPTGTLAGAQIEFNQNWTAPAGWTIQKNGSNVSSVQPGDVASVWSPENVRPLPEN